MRIDEITMWKTKLLDVKPLLLWAGLLIVLDQISKAWVRAALAVGQVYRPELPLSQLVRLIHLKNYGALGGFMSNYGGVISILMALICLAILVLYGRTSPYNRVTRLGMILLFAGGLGNLIDRLLLGAVTDFISILWLPVLNIADLYVLTGLVALIWGVDDGEKPKAGASARAAQTPGESTSSSEEARR
jgi:signal peptidase II